MMDEQSNENKPPVQVVLEGRLCRLRPYLPGDAPAIVRHANQREVWRGLYDIFPHPYTLELAEDWVAQCTAPHPDYLRLVIEVDGGLVGGIGLRGCGPFNEEYAEVGYWLGVEYWGRGIATEALRLVCGYAFAELRANRVEARVYGFNSASGRVLEKCGFTLEGRLRRRMVKDGERTDQLVYGLLPEEFACGA